MSAKAPASLRSAPASVVTSPAGITTSSGRAAKSSKVPSTSRKRATEASVNGATSPDVAPSKLGAFNWSTRTAPDAPSPDLRRFWGDNMVMAWRHVRPPSFSRITEPKTRNGRVGSRVRPRNRLATAAKLGHLDNAQPPLIFVGTGQQAWRSRCFFCRISPEQARACRPDSFQLLCDGSGQAAALDNKPPWIIGDERAFGHCYPLSW